LRLSELSNWEFFRNSTIESTCSAGLLWSVMFLVLLPQFGFAFISQAVTDKIAP